MQEAHGVDRPEEQPTPSPGQGVQPTAPTDRELLERLTSLVRKQQADLEVIRSRTGCLFAWLVTYLFLIVIGALVALGQ